VVTVMVRVDEGAHGPLSGLTAERVQKGPRPALGEAGVDREHGVAADDEAGVVQPPASIELHVAKHTRADLFDDRRRQIVAAMRECGGHGLIFSETRAMWVTLRLSGGWDTQSQPKA
jgi:hypothetical protein